MNYVLHRVPIQEMQYGNILDDRHGCADILAGDHLPEQWLLEPGRREV